MSDEDVARIQEDGHKKKTADELKRKNKVVSSKKKADEIPPKSVSMDNEKQVSDQGESQKMEGEDEIVEMKQQLDLEYLAYKSKLQAFEKSLKERGTESQQKSVVNNQAVGLNKRKTSSIISTVESKKTKQKQNVRYYVVIYCILSYSNEK